jgi:hypothetical protein
MSRDGPQWLTQELIGYSSVRHGYINDKNLIDMTTEDAYVDDHHYFMSQKVS